MLPPLSQLAFVGELQTISLCLLSQHTECYISFRGRIDEWNKVQRHCVDDTCNATGALHWYKLHRHTLCQ